MAKAPEWCPSGKHQHASEARARRQLRELREKFPGYKGRVYRCTRCPYWHVGRLLLWNIVERGRKRRLRGERR